MDQSALVKNGHALIDVMTQAGIPPRVAMWVHDTESDYWRLWIVPDTSNGDIREFYSRMVELIGKNRGKFTNGFGAADVERVVDTHPAIVGLSRMYKEPQPTCLELRDNMLNGYFLPEGILLLNTL